MFLPVGGVGTTKALSSTSLRGSVTSTLSPADTTSSLTVVGNNTGLKKVTPTAQKYSAVEVSYSCTLGLVLSVTRPWWGDFGDLNEGNGLEMRGGQVTSSCIYRNILLRHNYPHVVYTIHYLFS